MSWIKNEWAQTLAFFKKEILRTTGWVALAFVIIAAIAWVVLILNPALLMKAMKFLQEIMAGVSEDGVITAWELFANNIRACAIAVAYGFLPFFFLTGIALVVNGASIGIVGAMYQYMSMPMILLVAGLLPHGIFELPAIFISMAIGIRTCFLMSSRIVGKRTQLDMKQHFFQIVRVFVLIVIPLLIVAACVEAYITPMCMEYFV